MNKCQTLSSLLHEHNKCTWNRESPLFLSLFSFVRSLARPHFDNNWRLWNYCRYKAEQGAKMRYNYIVLFYVSPFSNDVADVLYVI